MFEAKEYFGKTLQRLRRIRGISRAQLAIRASLMPERLAVIENGAEPTFGEICLIAQGFGLAPAVLVAFSDYFAARVAHGQRRAREKAAIRSDRM